MPSIQAYDTTAPVTAPFDVYSTLLSEREAELLRVLSTKRESYIAQGRGREAHAMGTAILMVWQSITQPDIELEIPDSGFDQSQV